MKAAENQNDVVDLCSIFQREEISNQPPNGKFLNGNKSETLKRPLAPKDLQCNSPDKKRKNQTESTPASCKAMSKKVSKNTNFRYGNYDRYYGYRNTSDFKDLRLDAFQQHRHLFEERSVLDIGCNNGLITMAIARDFGAKHVIGIDIDCSLVKKARQLLGNEKRNCDAKDTKFPFNVEFKSGNYVLADKQLLDLELEQFDTILCLSVTKWIHLNCGDAGMKLAFQRMHKQLLPGGRLILEAQEFKSYKRRKNLTPDIAANYKKIAFFPDMFREYLMGNEVGFESASLIAIPKHSAKGFQRPIEVFVKKSSTSTVSTND